MGHARAILGVEKPSLQLKLYNETLKKGLSVRQVEALAKQYQTSENAPIDTNTVKRNKSDFDMLRKHLSDVFNTKVQISCDTSGKGKLIFPFTNEQQLSALIELFDKLK